MEIDIEDIFCRIDKYPGYTYVFFYISQWYNDDLFSDYFKRVRVVE